MKINRRSWLLLVIFFFFSIWLVYLVTKPDLTPPMFGIHLEGFPIDKDRLALKLQNWQKKPHFIGFFQQWPHSINSFNAQHTLDSLISIRHAGAVPVVTWEPMLIDANDEIVIKAEEIVSGQWDEYLKAYAKVLKQYHRPIIIRFAHEMNIVRYHWGSSPEKYHESYNDYKKMFRYVRDMIISEGATNTVWMFCPNHQPLTQIDPPEQAAWNTMKIWFPGEAYVDILGIDGYNWSTDESKGNDNKSSAWQNPWDIFLSPVDELQALAPNLPIVIGETATAGSASSRKNWINQLFKIAANRKLTAIMWFQVNKEHDWRLNPPEITQVEANIREYDLEQTESWLKKLINSRNTQARESSRAIE